MLAVTPGVAWGQTLSGAVLDEVSARPVSGALLRVVEEAGGRTSVAITDSAGHFEVELERPGEYRLAAEAFGYHPLVSLLVSLEQPSEYPVEILLAPAPIGLSGLDVSSRRPALLEREIRHAIGLDPSSLRNPLILRPEIESHMDRAHDVVDVVRWLNDPSVQTEITREGPCFRWRRRPICVPVYLNGARLTPGAVRLVPLEMVEVIAVVTPQETNAHAGGGIMLFTTSWIR